MWLNTRVATVAVVTNTTELVSPSVSVPTDKEPRPRGEPDEAYRPLEWPVCRSVKCTRVDPPPNQPFLDVLEARRSCRVMTRAPLRQLVNAVAFCTHPRAVLNDDPYGRSRRPSASAGALHPIDVLFVDRASRIFRYVPLSHQLESLRVPRPERLATFTDDCRQVLPTASGTPIVLVGDMGRIAALYHRPASLLWRDSGALMQNLALVMTAYRLAFCQLGILGAEVVHAIGLSHRATAVGVALAGRYAQPPNGHSLT